jgi:hypothetical protein
MRGAAACALALAAPTAALAAAVALLPARAALAQPAAQGVVAGTVVSAGTNTPVSDVQVRVQGTQIGAVTDAAGRFRIAGVPGTEAVLQVRRIGFQPVDQRVRVGAMDERIVLAQQATSLEQVVVTGTPGETRRRTVTCENSGPVEEPIAIGKIHGATAAAFRWNLPENGTERTLAPGESLPIDIDFTPPAAGEYAAEFEVDRAGGGGRIASILLIGIAE